MLGKASVCFQGMDLIIHEHTFHSSAELSVCASDPDSRSAASVHVGHSEDYNDNDRTTTPPDSVADGRIETRRAAAMLAQ